RALVLRAGAFFAVVLRAGAFFAAAFLAGAFFAVVLRAGAFFAAAFLAGAFFAVVFFAGPLPDTTASLNALSGVIFATRFALIFTGSPVAGLRPIRAARSTRRNFAKPEM